MSRNSSSSTGLAVPVPATDPTPPTAPVRPRNDPQQYDDLVGSWWDDRGRFAMLQWIAQARAGLVPPADREGALLVDIACGGGLMAPFVERLGYRHAGLDLSALSVRTAKEHGMGGVVADARRLPLADGCADVVLAGEVLEHVDDLGAVLAEAVRVLRPGGTLVIDTIASTWWGRFSSITIGERIPGGPPPRLHDGALFIDRAELVRRCADLGVDLTLLGMRPSLRSYLLWLTGRRRHGRMVRTAFTGGLFQAHGTKAHGTEGVPRGAA